MARNLQPLIQPITAPVEPGLDALDPRFSSITSLASRGQYSAAADQIEEIFAEEIFDIRLIVVYLFQAFREAGLSAFGDVLAVVDQLAGDGFETVGPVKKREETFDRRLGWLFGEITDTLEYHATKQTPEWDGLRAGMDEETLETIDGSLAAVGERIGARPFTHATRGLARLKGWLDAHSGMLAPPPAPAASAAGASAGGAPAQAPGAPVAGAGSPARPAFAAATLGSGEPSRWEAPLVVSFRFIELSRKLAAFEDLVRKRQFRKAALVADDLQQLIENFDPRSYFPDVFAGFSALLSENIEQLASHWEERESITWKALDQYYRTDLERFVKG